MQQEHRFRLGHALGMHEGALLFAFIGRLSKRHEAAGTQGDLRATASDLGL